MENECWPCGIPLDQNIILIIDKFDDNYIAVPTKLSISNEIIDGKLLTFHNQNDGARSIYTKEKIIEMILLNEPVFIWHRDKGQGPAHWQSINTDGKELIYTTE